MNIFTIQNEQLCVQVSTHGAELKSIKNQKDGTEYMWQADPQYWGRTSPVLFPLVGRLSGDSYQYEGKSYKMTQHGFARDMDFSLEKQTEDALVFLLQAGVDQVSNYPFAFKLFISYRLRENSLLVGWRVCNLDHREMCFSIGAHPAFCCPLNHEEKRSDYFLKFDAKDFLESSIIEGGLISTQTKTYALDEEGCLPVRDNLFDEDALVIEEGQIHSVSLCKPDRKPYVTVNFDAPLAGIWSKPHTTAEFVCIEPWYGRSDGVTFKGEISERKYGNSLKEGEEFQTEYEIKLF